MRTIRRWMAVGAALAAGLTTGVASAQIQERALIDGFLPIPASVMSIVGSVLPEGSQVGTSFLSGVFDPNLVVSEPANVLVTFVHEGAGYLNSLGYFTFVDDGSALTVTDRGLVLPNASYADPKLGWGGGKLVQGDTVSLRDANGQARLFQPGERIGFFLVAYGWQSGSVRGWTPLSPALPSTSAAANATAVVHTTIDMLNPEASVARSDVARHVALVSVAGIAGFLGGDPFHLMGFEDLRRDKSSDNDFNDLVLILRSNPPEAIAETAVPALDTQNLDPDGDGLSGLADYYPADAERGTAVRTPPVGLQTIVFEDTYPWTGDDDFNDAVIQYENDQVLSASGTVKDVSGTYHLMARGAGLDHRFGVAIHGLPSGVSGTLHVERFDPQDGSVIDPPASLEAFLADDGNGKLMLRLDHLFVSTMAALSEDGRPYTNTDAASPTAGPASVRFVVTFDVPLSPVAVGAAPFDPFLEVVHEDGLYDLHLPGKAPFADRPAWLPVEAGATAFLGPSLYPWALLVPYDFRYPLERVPIDGPQGAYSLFDDWRLSAGKTAPTWYATPVTSGTPARVCAPIAASIRARPWTVGVGP